MYSSEDCSPLHVINISWLTYPAPIGWRMCEVQEIFGMVVGVATRLNVLVEQCSGPCQQETGFIQIGRKSPSKRKSGLAQSSAKPLLYW
jgi:hypothetical protein